MDTSQYLSMFLEESMDNLQTLNDSLLQLEQEPDNIDKLNEIFRVAHTIKGMAATMGYNKMAELTHKMEDVLSEFRNGELKVTKEVVTVLFKCLDTLEQMVDDISEGEEEERSVDDIIKRLEAISQNPSEVSATVEKEQKSEAIIKTESKTDLKNSNFKEKMEINEYDLNIIKQASEKEYNVYQIDINLSEKTLLKSARAFLIVKNLEESGEIIKSIPSTEELENENFDYTISVVYISQKDKNEIQEDLKNISEVEEVIVNDIDLGNNTNVEVSKQSEASKQPEVSKQTNKKQVKKQVKPKKAKASSHKKIHQSVRVDLERLDKFMNMVSELVIHRTRLEQISNNYRLNDLNETLEQVARTTSDLQDLVMKIRMLPVDTVFNRFPRLVRDLSVELDKDMELIIQGKDTELDRTVIDEIGEPLIHLIRNAADHGIESREQRIKSGKNPEGKIKLIAYQEGTKAVIKVEDDGGGINLQKVKEKAESVGISTDGMSDSDIKALIFAQGFSTNKEVTDISGRGVGMDVVKTKIATLGGTVDLISEEGKGSSFIITLPLTLQIIQALLVKVGEETIAISLGYINEIVEYKETDIKKTNNKEVIIYRGNIVPIIRINKVLEIGESENSKTYVVIVKVGEKTVGILVDSLLGQQEIVIKPLGKTLKGLKEYIGATILGDGLVTLILDVAALV